MFTYFSIFFLFFLDLLSSVAVEGKKKKRLFRRGLLHRVGVGCVRRRLPPRLSSTSRSVHARSLLSSCVSVDYPQDCTELKRGSVWGRRGVRGALSLRQLLNALLPFFFSPSVNKGFLSELLNGVCLAKRNTSNNNESCSKDPLCFFFFLYCLVLCFLFCFHQLHPV